MILLAGPVAVFGGVVLYLREEVLDSQAFAARAANVISQSTMSRVVAREIVVQVVEPAQPDLIAARPLIEDGLTQVIRADAFRPVARLAAEHGHRLLFEQGSNAVFDIADAGAVVSSALRTLAPQIANKLPTHAEAVLLTIRRRSFAAGTLRFADTVRWMGLVFPVLAVALFAAGIALAPDRRRAITRAAVVVAVGAAALALALLVVRHYVVTHVYGTQELIERRGPGCNRRDCGRARSAPAHVGAVDGRPRVAPRRRVGRAALPVFGRHRVRARARARTTSALAAGPRRAGNRGPRRSA